MDEINNCCKIKSIYYKFTHLYIKGNISITSTPQHKSYHAHNSINSHTLSLH